MPSKPASISSALASQNVSAAETSQRYSWSYDRCSGVGVSGKNVCAYSRVPSNVAGAHFFEIDARRDAYRSRMTCATSVNASAFVADSMADAWNAAVIESTDPSRPSRTAYGSTMAFLERVFFFVFFWKNPASVVSVVSVVGFFVASDIRDSFRASSSAQRALAIGEAWNISGTASTPFASQGGSRTFVGSLNPDLRVLMTPSYW